MAVTTQIVTESPEIEARKLGLMDSAKELVQDPLTPPDYEYAGLTQLQKDAFDDLLEGGLGDFLPFLEEAAREYRASGDAITASDISQYMDPYTDEVISRVGDDLLRQRQMLDPTLAADAISAGAFSGNRRDTRAGLADEATLRQLGDISSTLRSQGFQSALGAAENEKARQALLASGLGSIAQTLPSLTQQELGFMLDVGTAEQAQKQAELDTERQNILQSDFEPYQRLSFLSDIYQGAPSSTMTNVFGASPTQPSPFQQLFGYGLAGLSAAGGAKQLGLFG